MSHARYSSSVSYNYSLKIQFKYHIQPNCSPLRLSYDPLPVILTMLFCSSIYHLIHPNVLYPLYTSSTKHSYYHVLY